MFDHIKGNSLRYISPEKLTILRQGQEKNFHYLDQKSGKKITDTAVCERIEQLVIPPAWKDVHISPDPRTHIQVIGSDAKGRKQYLYHPLWTQMQQQHKFEKVVFFGEVLPHLRRKVRADMKLRGLPKERVVATVVWLLETTFIRIGNDRYAKDNQSYGLTTLREKHVTVDGTDIKFAFKGKSGVFHDIDIHDSKVAKIIRKCLEVPGYELFQYLNENGQHRVVESADINDYLKAETGEETTAKDFRTWGGTNVAADALFRAGAFDSPATAKKNIIQAVKATATHLGNTPATSRSYYIHPTVISSYQQQKLVPHFQEVLQQKGTFPLHRQEYATWTLIREY